MFDIDEEKLLAASGCGNDCSESWVCKDGKVLLIREMEDSHLVNSMLKVQRDWPWRSRYYPCLVDEAKRRGLI